jgi:predicted transcriptional regulator
LIKVLFAPFFTRHKTEGPLESERRRSLYERIVEQPGLHVREALRRAGVPQGAGRYHVGILVRTGLVLERRYHGSVCLFPNERPFADSWRELAALRDPDARLLHDWLQANPNKTQLEIVASFAASHGWVRSTTQLRLNRLLDEGVLTVRQRGRFKLYSTARFGLEHGGQRSLAGPTPA